MLIPEVQLAYEDNERIQNIVYLYAKHIFLQCFIDVKIYQYVPDTEIKITLLCCSVSPANPLFHFTVSGDLCVLTTLFI